ncbi:DUF6387 family protein [Burkholderia gladioli]|uniref:DUF6387 family protein n=1 Tax=Burkholderia gladioli TaxID=28095 RepID=UPI0016402139|nr:DUF6387 family protein [Burkholderia gladioli]
MKANRAKFSDLPKNFDIRKYDVCGGWDMGWWVANVAHRLVRRASIEGTASDKKYMDIMRQASLDAFDDPELNWGCTDEWPLYGIPGGSPALARRVLEPTALDVLRSRELFEDEAFSGYTTAYEQAIQAVHPYQPGLHNPDAPDAQWEAVHKLTETTEYQMMRECGDENYGNSPFALAKVDLMAPDSELVDDFKHWLAQARKDRGIEQTSDAFTSADLRLWTEMRVLAYLDLCIWAELHGVTINLNVMGLALFPDEFNIGLGERVRKVVAREARRLMNMETLRSMQSQYAKAEREKVKIIPDS